MNNVTALSEYIIGTRDTLRQVVFLYRYRRRLAKGFKHLFHLRVVNVRLESPTLETFALGPVLVLASEEV